MLLPMLYLQNNVSHPLALKVKQKVDHLMDKYQTVLKSAPKLWGTSKMVDDEVCSKD